MSVVEEVSLTDDVSVTDVVAVVRAVEAVNVSLVVVVPPFGATGIGPPLELGGTTVEPSPADGVESCGVVSPVPLEASGLGVTGAGATAGATVVAAPPPAGEDGVGDAGATVVGVEETGSEGSEVGLGCAGAGLGGPAIGPLPAAGAGAAAVGGTLALALSAPASGALVPAASSLPDGAGASGVSLRPAPRAGWRFGHEIAARDRDAAVVDAAAEQGPVDAREVVSEGRHRGDGRKRGDQDRYGEDHTPEGHVLQHRQIRASTQAPSIIR